LLAFLLVEIVALAILSPVFLTRVNLFNIGLALATVGIMAAGMSALLFSGGLDLAIGSTAALAGTISAMLSSAGSPWWFAMAAGLLCGLLAGAVNGLIINYGRINAIIATLGTLSVYRGIAFILSAGQAFSVADPRLLYLGNGRIYGLPVPVLLTLVVFALAYLWLVRTVHGRYLYAVGGNEVACRLAGIPVARIRMLAYVVMGFLAGLSGLVTNGLLGVGIPYAAQGSELDVIAAVLLGGASLAGGEGTLLGTIAGLLVIGVLNNGMILLNVPAYWQTVAKGAVLLIAVGLDQYRRHRAGD
jgi:ribose/xylose/arabinose/galactoside ABC-type transport system permease subunit